MAILEQRVHQHSLLPASAEWNHHEALQRLENLQQPEEPAGAGQDTGFAMPHSTPAGSSMDTGAAPPLLKPVEPASPTGLEPVEQNV